MRSRAVNCFFLFGPKITLKSLFKVLQFEYMSLNLSDNELINYKKLQGYEKEDWLKSKRKDIFQKKQTEDLQQKIKADKKNISSPLDFNKEQAIEFINNLPVNLRNSFFAMELRKKWNL